MKKQKQKEVSESFGVAPFKTPVQKPPGTEDNSIPTADYGEISHPASHRLAGKKRSLPETIPVQVGRTDAETGASWSCATLPVTGGRITLHVTKKSLGSIVFEV